MTDPRLLLAALFMPLAVYIIVHFIRPLHKYRGHANLASILSSVLILVALWIGSDGHVYLAMPNVLVVGLNLHLDSLSFFFAMLFGITASIVSLFAIKYLDVEDNANRFMLFSQLTFIGCLGVVLAADLLTLFLFFEFMTFSSYVLVIHRETREAISAGNTYIFMGVAGGLVLLMGIILLFSVAGTTAFVALPAAVAANTRIMTVAAFCFLIGFGIKTGVTPLHIWMPKAYSVSPVIVNAVSSGIMIKTGVYGLVRVFYQMFFTAESPLEFGPTLGWFLLWMGLVSMFVGGFVAIRQNNLLRTLAYSSISQIGYILMGLGVSLIPYGNAGYGLSGTLLHVLNHTVFKGTLFLILAVIYFYTKTLDYSKLGGLLKRSPILSIAFVVSALGITGIPLLNGYVSKTYLHHGVYELYKYNPTALLWLAEKIFVVSSVFTMCYFTKMFFQVFWGESTKEVEKIPKKLPSVFNIGLLIGSLAVVLIGVLPGTVVSNMAAPAMAAAGASQYVVDYAINASVWVWADVLKVGMKAGLAALLYLGVVKFNFDKLPVPQWLCAERLFYRPVSQGFMLLCMGPGVVVDRKVNQMYHGTGGLSYSVCQAVGIFDKSINKLYDSAGSYSSKVCRALGVLDREFSSLYEKFSRQGHAACLNLSGFDENLDKLYSELGLGATKAINKVSAMENVLSSSTPPLLPKTKTVAKSQQDAVTWHIANLNVEGIVVAVALVVVVVIFVFFGS